LSRVDVVLGLTLSSHKRRDLLSQRKLNLRNPIDLSLCSSLGLTASHCCVKWELQHASRCDDPEKK
jgi:hypothetical protein